MTVQVSTRNHQYVTNVPFALKIGDNQHIIETANGYLKKFPVPSPPYTDVIDPETGRYIYGFRDVIQTDADGNERWVQVPLTYEDYLHPEEGDTLMSISEHEKVLAYVKGVFLTEVPHVPPPTIFREVGMDFNMPNINPYRPDISVVYGVTEPNRPRSTFNVREEGTMPSMVIEVTSPSNRHADFDRKLQGYTQAGVPYYIIIDTIYDRRTDEINHREIIGYELTPNGYIIMQPNAEGRLWLDPVGMWIGLEGYEVRCYDTQGDYLPNHQELRQEVTELRTHMANTETQLANTETQLVESEARANESEARANAMAEYLRSLGIDPENLPT
ncbi:MAG: Uma2 family endonuclease [Chloroflexota bacterium]